MINQRKAYIFGMTTVIMWSTVATAFKVALASLDIPQLIFYASLVSASLLTAVIFYQGRCRELWQTFCRHWRITLIAATLNPMMYYLVLFAAYDRLPAQVAQPINYTWAIVLSIMSVVILKQRLTCRDVFAALICYGGVVLIATRGQWNIISIESPIGIALALASTLIWASYWILNIRDPREPLVALCLNFLCAVPMAGLICWYFSSLWVTSGSGLLSAAYIGLFEMGLAFLCWSQALRLAQNTSRVSNLIFLSPFLSLILIHFILGEPIYSTTYLGLIVIVAGLLLQKSGVVTSGKVDVSST
ncbi:MAG: drug/metabolite transporter (DMT)-like permease [Candidatus Pseudothioglobus sp.]|jgi:drug/metabolite transporter (DMT)-like permease